MLLVLNNYKFYNDPITQAGDFVNKYKNTNIIRLDFIKSVDHCYNKNNL